MANLALVGLGLGWKRCPHRGRHRRVNAVEFGEDWGGEEGLPVLGANFLRRVEPAPKGSDVLVEPLDPRLAGGG